jgi:RNA-directed DNA polymerase
METTMEELAPYMRVWRSYFGFCETPEVLIGLTRWVRLRVRAALWRQWKTPRRRRAALLELGVREPLASNTAGSGRGPWYLAKAKALSVGLSNTYFRSLGLRPYSSTVSVTLSNRRVRTRTHGGVAGVGG